MAAIQRPKLLVITVLHCGWPTLNCEHVLMSYNPALEWGDAYPLSTWLNVVTQGIGDGGNGDKFLPGAAGMPPL